MRNTLTRYLSKHAEPDHGVARELRDYRHVIAVPAYDEGLTIAPLLDSVPRNRDALLVLVINADEDAAEGARDANALSHRHALQRGPNTPLSDGTLVEAKGFDMLVLNKTVPRRRGVGLARKIGGDVAASLASLGRLSSGWLHMTDADAVLPPDYLDASPMDGSVAYLHAFEHIAVAGHEAHIQAYEAHLHHYVRGLARARSRYAFHSIGSTISVQVQAYAAVRGVPRRPAAEDFYLLDKLAKLGPIEESRGSCIRLSGRPSHRVPFGTGVSVRKDLSELERTYDPRSYEALGGWLRAIERDEDARQALADELPASLREHEGAITEALTSLGAFEAVTRARAETRTVAAYLRNVHTFFDGFRAMKLIRGLRETFPDVPLLEALEAEDLGDALALARRADLERRIANPRAGFPA